jgi:hypothetical protein
VTDRPSRAASGAEASGGGEGGGSSATSTVLEESAKFAMLASSPGAASVHGSGQEKRSEVPPSDVVAGKHWHES